MKMNKLLTGIAVTAGFLVGLLIVFLKIGVEILFVAVGIYYLSEGLMDDPITFMASWTAACGTLLVLNMIKQVLK